MLSWTAVNGHFLELPIPMQPAYVEVPRPATGRRVNFLEGSSRKQISFHGWC